MVTGVTADGGDQRNGGDQNDGDDAGLIGDLGLALINIYKNLGIVFPPFDKFAEQ